MSQNPNRINSVIAIAQVMLQKAKQRKFTAVKRDAAVILNESQKAIAIIGVNSKRNDIIGLWISVELSMRNISRLKTKAYVKLGSTSKSKLALNSTASSLESKHEGALKKLQSDYLNECGPTLQRLRRIKRAQRLANPGLKYHKLQPRKGAFGKIMDTVDMLRTRRMERHDKDIEDVA